jgi:hypothetical protein
LADLHDPEPATPGHANPESKPACLPLPKRHMQYRINVYT